MSRKAVVLFNLGAPDKLQSVKPFLFNLFNDRAIIDLPNPFRFFLAKFISQVRHNKAKDIYKQIGGKSPLLENTLLQAKALEKELGSAYKVFTCMRYWHPMIEEVKKEIKNYNPQEIILLPLYPQYSTTTTGSSFNQWYERNIFPAISITEISNYPIDEFFINSIANKLNFNMKDTVVLFTAHGLPQSIIDKGDPYQKQIEATVNAILQKVKIDNYSICYQSRVGPKAWIKPYADQEIIKYSKQNKNIIVVPVSFVSEHSETLVELDIIYQALAIKNGAKSYKRITANGICETFIKGLADLITSKVAA